MRDPETKLIVCFDRTWVRLAFHSVCFVISDIGSLWSESRPGRTVLGIWYILPVTASLAERPIFDWALSEAVWKGFAERPRVVLSP